MHQVLKIFFLFVFILVVAFFANYYGYISIPGLEIKSIPTYGSEVKAVDDAVQEVMQDEIADKSY